MAIRVSSPTSFEYAGGSAGANPDLARVEAARRELYGLARGSVGAQDPVDQEIMAALRGRATGGMLPYDEATKNALFSQQAQMNEARQTAERDRLSRSGVSAADPAFQAQMRANQARSDAAMQQARMGVNTQANLANYAAQGQALGQYGGYQQQLYGNQMDAQNRLMSLLSREEATQRQPMSGATIGRQPGGANPSVPWSPTLLPSGNPQGVAPGTILYGSGPRPSSTAPATTGGFQSYGGAPQYQEPQQPATKTKTTLPPTIYPTFG